MVDIHVRTWHLFVVLKQISSQRGRQKMDDDAVSGSRSANKIHGQSRTPSAESHKLDKPVWARSNSTTSTLARVFLSREERRASEASLRLNRSSSTLVLSEQAPAEQHSLVRAESERNLCEVTERPSSLHLSAGNLPQGPGPLHIAAK